MPASGWSRLRLCLAAALVIGGVAVEAAGQETRVPARVGTFVITDSSRYEQAELGIMYTYRDSAERVAGNAFVYPVPADRLRLPPEQQVALEAETFATSLQEGVEEGWYIGFEVPVSEARSWDTADGPRPGHLAVAAIRRQDAVHISFMHLVLVGDHYVKTRLTLPAEQWRESLAPNFGPDLFRLLAGPAPVQQPAPAPSAGER